jgi:transposase
MNPSILRNLTSEQWELLSGLIPAPKTGGRKRSVEMEAIAYGRASLNVNAILYILCAAKPVANAAKRFSQMENCISLLPAMAY